MLCGIGIDNKTVFRVSVTTKELRLLIQPRMFANVSQYDNLKHQRSSFQTQSLNDSLDVGVECRGYFFGS